MSDSYLSEGWIKNSVYFFVCLSTLCLIIAISPVLSHQIIENEKTIIQNIIQAQQEIKQLIPEILTVSGERQLLREYNILHNINRVDDNMQILMGDPDKHKKFIRKALKRSMSDIDRMNLYYQINVNKMLAMFEKVDNKVYLTFQLADLYHRQDKFLISEHKTIQWGAELGITTISNRTNIFIEKIKNRANLIIAFLKYNQGSFYNADLYVLEIKELYKKGYDVNQLLKERTALATQSLSVAIKILDDYHIDTSSYKVAHTFSSSGITQYITDKGVFSGVIQLYFNKIKRYVSVDGPELLIRVLIFFTIILIFLIISFFIKLIVRMILDHSHSKIKMSYLLKEVIVNIAGKIIILFGIVLALFQIGLNLAPILAGLGIASLVVGFALKETLSNLVSGIMILIYRPFDVGDLVTAAGVTGVVSHMSLVSTTMKTYDNERLIIPNTMIWEGIIDNQSSESVRRIDMTFCISYEADIIQVEALLMETLIACPGVLKHPLPLVRVDKLNDSWVEMTASPWVRPADYWEVRWSIIRAVKLRFDEEGITIPFPQIDIHYKEPGESKSGHIKESFISQLLKSSMSDAPKMPVDNAQSDEVIGDKKTRKTKKQPDRYANPYSSAVNADAKSQSPTGENSSGNDGE